MSRLRNFFGFAKKGFTLVEIIVVLAIMALAATLVVPNLSGLRTRAERDTYEASLATAKSHVNSFVALLTSGENNYYITENYKVTTCSINSPQNLKKALNYTNQQSAYDYYVVSYEMTDANKDPTDKVKADSATKKDTIIPVIVREGNDIYTLKGLWYYSFSLQQIIYTYETKGTAKFKDGWQKLGG